MTLSTVHADFTRAVFEGTAFALRHVLTTIREAGGTANSLRITGGGSKSREWSQIKASMLNMPVLILDEKSGEVPFGDGLIAGHAVGIYPDLTEVVKKLIKVKEVIQPKEKDSILYDKLYPYYVDLYKDLDNDLRKLRNSWITLSKLGF